MHTMVACLQESVVDMQRRCTRFVTGSCATGLSGRGRTSLRIALQGPSFLGKTQHPHMLLRDCPDTHEDHGYCHNCRSKCTLYSRLKARIEKCVSRNTSEN